MSVKPNIEELLDWLESESYAAREGIGLRRDYEDARRALLARYAELERERDEALSENALLTYKILTCGVAASHPNPELSRRAKDYGGPWDSPQAEAVRKLRAERDEAMNLMGQYRAERNDLQSKLNHMTDDRDSYKADAERYRELATPEVADFLAAVEREALHQRDRWGVENDGGKTDADWFWLIGYLAGKALHKPEKLLHHVITTAAACLNWHAARTGNYTAMRPGIADPDAAIAQRGGKDA